jgi:hypothetical protein
MRSDPNPDEIVAIWNRQSVMGDTDSNGPEFADFSKRNYTQNINIWLSINFDPAKLGDSPNFIYNFTLSALFANCFLA